MDETRIAGSPKSAGTASPTAGAERPGRGRGIAFQAAAVLLTVVSGLAGTGLARWLRAPDGLDRSATSAVKFPNRLFLDWNKPDLVLVLTGQEHGYLLPCGCSRPQVGGLERQYNFLQMIKAAGWPYVAVDLGDVPQRRGPAGLPNQQGLIKYVYSMNALKTMDFTAVGFGENEANLGLSTVLAEWALNEPKPRVLASNLLEADKNYPDQTKPGISVLAGGLKIGIASVVSPTTAGKIHALTGNDKKVQFEDVNQTLTRVVRQMQARNVDFPVLLYQGPVTTNDMKRPPTEAVAVAEAYPEFPILLCLSDEDHPPSVPLAVTTRSGSKSLVVTLGHKGKFVGVVGVWKTGKPNTPYTFRYERAEMTEDFLTPAEKEKGHPIVELMENYTKELRDKGYLEKYGQVRHAVQVMPAVQGLDHPGEAKFVGSERCMKCHKDAYKIWTNTPHAHAYKTLVDAKRPANRQYDPECIVCHTVGFGYQTGFINEKINPHLENVGCEACHGPGSLHAANEDNIEWRRRVNPWKYLPAAQHVDAMDRLCQKCHDIDNDVTWIGDGKHGGFEKKWPKIKHYKVQAAKNP